MTARNDLDTVLDAFFAEGPSEIADDVIEASLRLIDTTDQRRAGFGSRRTRSMSTLSRFALVAAAVVAVALAGSLILPALEPIAGTSSTQPTGLSPAPSRPGASDESELLAPLGYAGGGTIVFSRAEPANGSEGATWRIRPDGSGEAALRVTAGWGATTDLPGTGCCAVLSPDRVHVAVGYDEINPLRSPGISRAAQILNLDGSTTIDSTTEQYNHGIGLTIPMVCGGCASITGVDYVPRAWSADGSLVAAEVWSDLDPTRDGMNVAPVKPLGPENWETQVAGAHRDVPVAFSPDGSMLLFVRLTVGRSGTLMVLSVGRDRGIATFGTPRAVSAAGARVFADGSLGPAASWSPDGGTIAFAATDEAGSTGAMSAYVVPARGGAATRIAGPAADLASASWSPDGAWIAFDRPTDAGGPHDEFIIRPDGSQLTNLTDGFGPGVCCGRWSPDSSALLGAATLGDERRSDLVIVPIDGRLIAQVTRTPGSYTDFSWSPAAP